MLKKAIETNSTQSPPIDELANIELFEIQKRLKCRLSKSEREELRLRQMQLLNICIAMWRTKKHKDVL